MGRTGMVSSMRDMIACMRVRPLLQAVLDGELEGKQRARVLEHVEACRRCGLSASAFEALKARLSEQGGRPPSRHDVARLEQFVDELARQAPEGELPSGGAAPKH